VVTVESNEPGDQAKPFQVVALRTTGIQPEAVAEMLEAELAARSPMWKLQRVEPIIYNSSTTGYLLLIFARSENPTS
jgi:hypothetical protein